MEMRWKIFITCPAFRGFRSLQVLVMPFMEHTGIMTMDVHGVMAVSTCHPDVAKWIYRWTNPVVPPNEDYLHLPGQGTRVQIV